jgi:hypothetical protein
MFKAKSYASVWDALADFPRRAANLRARAALIASDRGHCSEEPLDADRGCPALRNYAATHERPAARPRVPFSARRAVKSPLRSDVASMRNWKTHDQHRRTMATSILRWVDESPLRALNRGSESAKPLTSEW